MPHQCTNCNHLFDDGSEEMLSGCPDCGGNKFQFRPKDWTPDDETQPDTGTDTSSEDTTESDIIDASEHGESPAQQSARSDVVSPSDMPNISAWPDESTPSEDEPSDADVDDESEPEDPYEKEAWEQEQKEEVQLEELRAELNDQFESIKILSPGEYKLNLMELYESQEYIIALQEDGKYMIEVPNYMHTDTEGD